jgi:hypothetical protein
VTVMGQSSCERRAVVESELRLAFRHLELSFESLNL